MVGCCGGKFIGMDVAEVSLEGWMSRADMAGVYLFSFCFR